MAVRLASRTYGVPKSTLQDRLLGKFPEKQGKRGPGPLLTVEGERKIADWVMNLAKCGFPIKKIDLIETVEKIVKDSGQKDIFKDGKPGQRWYQNFLKRHPAISLREAEGINKARAVVTEESIRLWFVNLENYLRDNNLLDVLKDPERILNGDESGFSLCPKTGKVLAPKGWKNLYQIKKGNEKENITVLICFTASGKICPPLVVFPYIRPPRSVIDNIPKTWVLGKSDTGWMKGDVFYEYIVNEFNTWLTKNNIKRPVLLFIDGHKSHMTMALSEACEINGIILYALPPNTTHILQPADVSVFRPLKEEWRKTIRKWQSLPENVNTSVTKTNFCKVFEMALRGTNMESHIKNGFQKCGLYPLNPNNVDYTKCVKNLIETQKSKLTLPEEKISSEECRIAEKVIKRIKNSLYTYGINVDVILNEIHFLESPQNETLGSESYSMSKSASNIEVGSVVNLDDVTLTPIDFDTIIFNEDMTTPASFDNSPKIISNSSEKLNEEMVNQESQAPKQTREFEPNLTEDYQGLILNEAVNEIPKHIMKDCMY